MFTNASGMEEEPLKLLIQEKGIGNVYNNVNGNALVLCPYFGCMRAQNLDLTVISQFLKWNAYRNNNFRNIFSYFSLLVFLSFFSRLFWGLKNYTLNTASPAVLGFLSAARFYFSRFLSQKSLHSCLKVMEPACVCSACWKSVGCSIMLGLKCFLVPLVLFRCVNVGFKRFQKNKDMDGNYLWNIYICIYMY